GAGNRAAQGDDMHRRAAGDSPAQSGERFSDQYAFSQTRGPQPESRRGRAELFASADALQRQRDALAGESAGWLADAISPPLAGQLVVRCRTGCGASLGASDCQSLVATSFRAWHRQYAERLWFAGRQADAPRTAGVAGERVDRARLAP